MTDERCSQGRSPTTGRNRVQGHAKRHGFIVPSMAGVIYDLASALDQQLAMRRHELRKTRGWRPTTGL